MLTWLVKTAPQIKGTVVADKKTKKLIQRVKPGQIAVIAHTDIDEMAARDLIQAKVKAVVNCHPSMTGSYPTIGTKLLLEHKIPVFDANISRLDIPVTDGSTVLIEGELIYLRRGNEYLPWAIATPVDQHYVMKKWEQGEHNMQHRLLQFIENTLEYAQLEKDYYIKPLPPISVKLPIRKRHVLVVVRGKHYKQDLKAIRPYIDDYRPVLIGVDGGADALMENGLLPDMIIGDMDSVSDEALHSGAEIVVHAYPDGRAPGLKRLDELGIKAHILSAPGTSEDIAMLYAYEQGAEFIVTLGTHSNMVDFLEKGRKGMASTVLVRMKIGMKLIDAKGVSMLYQKRLKWNNLLFVGMAATFPIAVISVVSPPIRHIWQIIRLQLKILFS